MAMLSLIISNTNILGLCSQHQALVHVEAILIKTWLYTVKIMSSGSICLSLYDPCLACQIIV